MAFGFQVGECDCPCASGTCSVPISCLGGRGCRQRFGGITRNGSGFVFVDITPETGWGTARGITVIDPLHPDVVIACNSAGDVFRTVDRGDDWTHQNLAVQLLAIHSRGSQVIMVGAAGSAFYSTNQGQNWTPGMVSGITGVLNSVWMVSSSLAYACGNNGTILKTSDGGQTWISQISGVTTELISVHFLDKNSGFVVGESGVVLRTSNGGNSWQPVAGMTGDGDCVLMLSRDDVFLFSRSGTTTTKWHWDGTLTNAGAGPTVATGRLSMAEILCRESDEPPLTPPFLMQANGCLVCPSLKVQFRGSNGPTTPVTPTAQHQNRIGDMTPYTLSVKQWGGINITGYTALNDATHGHDHPSLRLSVDWSQTDLQPAAFPQPNPPSFDPPFGAWLVFELSGGPQLTLAADERLSRVQVGADTKRMALANPNTAWSLIQMANSGFTFTDYRFVVDGETTTPLSYNSSTAQIQAAINTLSGVNGNAEVSGWPINETNHQGENRLAFKWLDDTMRTITATGGAGVQYQWQPNFGTYQIVPVVIQGGVVYGPSPVMSRGPYTTTEDAVDACWQSRGGFNQCPGYLVGFGGRNRGLYDRYKSFLEMPSLIPNGFGGQNCVDYCRPQDSFGDWANASLVPISYVVVQGQSAAEWVPETLDFSSGSFSFGFAVGVYADVPGAYSTEILIDNICLEWTAAAIAPICGATQIINEPMSSSVPLWLGAIMNCDTIDRECSAPIQYYGAQWRIETGWMVTDRCHDVETTFVAPDSFVGVAPYWWRDRMYAGGSLFQRLATWGAPANWKTNTFCLTVECELSLLRDDDGAWSADDAPFTPSNPTEYDLNQVRPEEDFGIMIGGLCKFGIRRNAIFINESYLNHNCNRSFFYLQQDGAILGNGDLLKCGNHLDCNHSTMPWLNDPFCSGDRLPRPWRGSYDCGPLDQFGFPGTHEVFSGALWCDTRTSVALLASAVPLKTAKLRLEVRWSGLENNTYDCRAADRFYVLARVNDSDIWMQIVYPNGATVNGGRVFNVSKVPPAGSPAFTWLQEPTVGVYAHRGGRFRNFKCWYTP